MAWYDPTTWFKNNRFSLTDTRATVISRLRASGIEFFESNGETKYVSTENSEELREAFEKCAPLSSILSYLGKSFADAKVEILQANNDNYVRGQYKDWDKLMQYPNQWQNGAQFLKQLYIYTKVNGFSFILKTEAAGFAGTGLPPKSLYVLPYWLIDIKETHKPINELSIDDVLDNVYFRDDYGHEKKLPKESLILIRDTTGLLDERFHLPISRVAINKYPISTLVSAAEAEITMIQNRGATGILSDRSGNDVEKVPLQNKQKEELQSEFGGYGLSRRQRQVIITNANLEWQPMNYPTRELMLHESYTKGVKDLCDAFGMPFELLSHSDRKNLSNVEVFDKVMYQNTIIPEGKDVASQLSIGLGLNKLKSPIYINFDYSHVAALQKSEKEKGEGLDAMFKAYQQAWDLGLMTRNMILEAIGMDTQSAEEFNKYKWELEPAIDETNKDNGTANNTPVQE